MTQAIRQNMGWSKGGAEQLNRENTQAIARLGYDPNTAPRRPSPEEIGKAAAELFSRIKLHAHTPKS